MATNLRERMMIRVCVEIGMSDRDIAEKLHRSAYAVRKWRRRTGRGKGLGSKMGRPLKGALGSFDSEIRPHLKVWLEGHLGW